MKFYVWVIILFGLFESCQNSTSKNNDLDSLSIPAKTITKKHGLDTSKMPMNDRIKNLIEVSAIKQFESSRQLLVEQGAKYQYQITEIKQFGKSYNYNVFIPNTNIKMDYTCIPERGEYSVYMIGDRDLVLAQYNQIKVQNTWEISKKIEEGERCESDKKDKAYPITTHLMLSITYSGNHEAILNFKRKTIPYE